MSDFFIGQKVVCVDDSEHPEWSPDVFGDRLISYWITKGNIYIIRDFLNGRCRLNGINRAGNYNGRRWNDAGFSLARFRPLESKAISIFRAIAANPNIKIREDA